MSTTRRQYSDNPRVRGGQMRQEMDDAAEVRARAQSAGGHSDDLILVQAPGHSDHRHDPGVGHRVSIGTVAPVAEREIERSAPLDVALLRRLRRRRGQAEGRDEARPAADSRGLEEHGGPPLRLRV